VAWADFGRSDELFGLVELPRREAENADAVFVRGVPDHGMPGGVRASGRVAQLAGADPQPLAQDANLVVLRDDVPFAVGQYVAVGNIATPPACSATIWVKAALPRLKCSQRVTCCLT